MFKSVKINYFLFYYHSIENKKVNSSLYVPYFFSVKFKSVEKYLDTIKFI